MEQALDLPEDPEALRLLVHALTREVQQLKAHQSNLQETIRLLLHKRFGAKSEKYPAGQSDLFNEAEAYAEDSDGPESLLPTTAEADLSAVAPAPATPSAKRGRKALPTGLPRTDIVHDLPVEQRYCNEGHALVVIGEEVSEQLDIIPAKIQVLRHIRKKYACPCCGAGVKTAPVPPQPIPKSNASAGLLAYIVTAKFLDALPLYRQSKQFQRIGVYLPRATLASWMIRCGGLVQALCNLMQEQLNRYPIQQMDETTVQVLKEDGKAATSLSYMWVQRGGPPEQPVIRFSYSPSRSQEVADQLLLDFQGILQTDGYAGYLTPCAKNGLRHAGCWAHVRRKFDEALKAQDPKATAKAGKASEALVTIQALYRIEKAIKDLPVADKLQIRQQKAVPILNAMKDWLDTSLTRVPPSTLTGKALTYLSNQWPTLTVYCEDGHLDIDNNAIERAIRPFVIGRNNWMFSDTVKGVNASANLYSLVETAKLNGLEPYRYLHHVFNELPKAQTLEDIEQLLPWNVDKDAINQGWKN
jgi:transposase